MSPQDFALSVVGDDVKSLTRVPGIGAKTAQLIILKLTDKLAKEQGYPTLPASGTNGKSGGAALASSGGNEAMSALLVLGFSAAEAAGALSGLPVELTTSEKIKEALKKLSSK
jgi:Holliday junction DNA helicase RuvA